MNLNGISLYVLSMVKRIWRNKNTVKAETDTHFIGIDESIEINKNKTAIDNNKKNIKKKNKS